MMRRPGLCLLFLCAFHLPVSAHVLDEYLQVAQIGLAPDGVRIDLRLIPGVEVADRILALIDTDGDGQITRAEEQTYARRVLRDIEFAVNGVNTPLALAGVQFPSRHEMNEGIGAIRLVLVAEAAYDSAGEHQLAFRSNHMPELGVYLVNALVPATSEIRITGLSRDPLQREMRLSFHVTPANAGGSPHWTGVLIFLFSLALLIPLSKHLRGHLRRTGGDGVQAGKSFS